MLEYKVSHICKVTAENTTIVKSDKDCFKINLTRQYNKADINCTSRYVCKYSIIDEQPETQLTLYYHDKDIALEISM